MEQWQYNSYFRIHRGRQRYPLKIYAFFKSAYFVWMMRDLTGQGTAVGKDIFSARHLTLLQKSTSKQCCWRFHTKRRPNIPKHMNFWKEFQGGVGWGPGEGVINLLSFCLKKYGKWEGQEPFETFPYPLHPHPLQDATRIKMQWGSRCNEDQDAVFNPS